MTSFEYKTAFGHWASGYGPSMLSLWRRGVRIQEDIVYDPTLVGLFSMVARRWNSRQLSCFNNGA
jgi:hypothetical protein